MKEFNLFPVRMTKDASTPPIRSSLRAIMRSLILILSLLIGTASIWAETVKSTFTKATVPTDNQVTDLEDVVTWDIATTVGEGSPSFDVGKNTIECLKFGSSGSVYFSKIEFSTEYFKDVNVKSVTMYMKNNGKKIGTLTAKQGSITLGSKSHSEATIDWGSLTTDETATGAGGILTVSYEVAQASYISYIEVTYEEAGVTTAKTLTGVVVSGTPIKTSYYAGDEFEPAGLVVTGYYDDETNAPIASGITWSYETSSTLVEDQTSINVKATVNEITSAEWYEVSGLTVAKAPTTVTFNYADYKGKGTQSSGSEYTMEKSQVTIGDTKFYGNNSYAHFYANSETTITPAAGVTITKIVLTASANDYNGYQSSGTVTASNGSLSANGTIVTWTGSADEAFTISHNKQIRWTSIVVTYEQGEAPAVAKPTISGETPFVGSTEVTITAAGADDAIYYTLDGTDPTASSMRYTAAFTLDATATVKAIAVKGEDISDVASKEFTKITQLTIAQVLEGISATEGEEFILNDVTVTYAYGNNVYVKDATGYIMIYSAITGAANGKVLQGLQGKAKLYNGLPEVSTVTKAPTVSDGTAVEPIALSAYPTIEDLNKYVTLEGVTFAADATLSGSVVNVNGTFDGATLIIRNQFKLNGISVATGKSYSVVGIVQKYNDDYQVYPITITEIVVEGAPEAPVFTPAAGTYTEVQNVTISCTTEGAAVYYTTNGDTPDNTSTLYSSPIEVEENMTIKAIAIKDGKESSLASAEYVINLPENEETSKTWDLSIVSCDANPTEALMQWSATYVTMTNAKGSGTKVTNYYPGTPDKSYTSTRFYNNNTITIIPNGKRITSIVFTATTETYAKALQGSTWTNATAAVSGNVVTVTPVDGGQAVIATVGGTCGFTAVKVNYVDDNREAAGLSWSEDDVELTVGETFTAPTLNNPNSIAASEISIESNNTDLATVSEGVVSLVENATGEATITATFLGNDDYKPASVSYTITVNEASAVLTDYYEKVTSTAGIVEGTYLIVYEAGNVAFNGGLETLDAASNTIDVEITNNNKIGVTDATKAATFYLDVEAGTIQSKSGKYIGVSSWANGLKQTDTYVHNVLEIDDDGNAQVGIYNAEWNTTGGTMRLQYNKGAGQTRFRYFKDGGQQPIALYKLANETVKDNPELAWSADVEMIVGGEFTSPTLNHATGITGTITYSSDKETVATVDENGVISLVPEATGTVHITASYAGDENFKEGSAVCTIKVNPAHSIYIEPSLKVDFGSVAKDATVENKVIKVTLTGVEAATATLAGDGASAFSISSETLTESGDITISASSATTGTFNATLTISDDASEAAKKDVSLKLIVTDPAAVETPISTSSKWVAATDITDGMQVLITGVGGEVTYAMGEQKNTNRAAYVASVDGEGVLTPGEGTMAFTLVAQGDGTYAIRTSDGKFLYAAADNANYLKTQDEVDVNAKWTLTTTSAVAEGSANRNIMRFNSGNSKLFSCYASGQDPIQLYVPKAEEPVEPDYGSYTRNVTSGNYGTICLPKTGTISGATLFDIASYENEMIYVDEVSTGVIEAGKPYIFQATDNQLNVTYTSATAVEAGQANGLHGYYDLDNMTADEDAQKNLDQDAGNYILYQNQYWLVSGRDAYVNNFRAYIKIAEINNVAPAPGRRRIAMAVNGAQTATGIDALNASEKPVKVMSNGQFFILRGEKLYDATGRLVK